MSMLDRQMQAFVAQSLSHDPENATHATALQQRQYYKAKCLEIAQPMPVGIEVKDTHIKSSDGYLVPVRHYSHNLPTNTAATKIVFFHGGGFVVGDLDSHHDICGHIAKDTGLDLVAVDYRLAPEYQYPDDINDCLTVVDYFLNQAERIVLVGDSAGGTLSASVAYARRQFVNVLNGPSIIGQVLIYPALTCGTDTPSMIEHANAPLLSKADMDYYFSIRVGGEAKQIPTDDNLYTPMQRADYKGLPATHLFPAQIDPLRDDCALYEQALKQAQVKVTNHLELGEGLVHGYLRARAISDKAAHNFKAICTAIKELGEAN